MSHLSRTDRGPAPGNFALPHLNEGGALLVNDLERPVSHILLDLGIIETTSNQTLGVENGLARVHGGLVLGRISDQALRLGEGNVRRGGTVTLVVGDNLDTVILPHTNARVGGSEIDTCGRRTEESQGHRTKMYVNPKCT